MSERLEEEENRIPGYFTSKTSLLNLTLKAYRDEAYGFNHRCLVELISS